MFYKIYNFQYEVMIRSQTNDKLPLWFGVILYKSFKMDLIIQIKGA